MYKMTPNVLTNIQSSQKCSFLIYSKINKDFFQCPIL